MIEAPDPTREALKADPLPPIVPTRFRRALVRTIDAAVPPEFGGEIGQWLHEHRADLVRGGDDAGDYRFAFDLPAFEEAAPAALLAPLRRTLASVASPEALAEVAVPEFDVRHVDIGATLFHHGGHEAWHDDGTGADGELAVSRRVAFSLFLHSTPKMFSGGELEFTDGTVIEPKHGRLAVYHPVQSHRFRRVECWSAHVLHGLWIVHGWIHGEPPAGWAERLAALRG